jgi:hypothetical protein
MLLNSKLRKQKLPKVTDRVYDIDKIQQQQQQEGNGGVVSKPKEEEEPKHDWLWHQGLASMIDLKDPKWKDYNIERNIQRQIDMAPTREREAYRYAPSEDEAYNLREKYLENQRKGHEEFRQLTDNWTNQKGDGKKPINKYKEWHTYILNKLGKDREKNWYSYKVVNETYTRKRMNKLPIVEYVQKVMEFMVEINQYIMKEKYEVAEDAIKFKTFKSVVHGPLIQSKTAKILSTEDIVEEAYKIIKFSLPFVKKYSTLSSKADKYLKKTPDNFKTLIDQAKVLEKYSKFDNTE